MEVYNMASIKINKKRKRKFTRMTDLDDWMEETEMQEEILNNQQMIFDDLQKIKKKLRVNSGRF